jgi:hypothetical protein
VNAELVQLARDAQFVEDRERNAFGLRAITKRGVVEKTGSMRRV